MGWTGTNALKGVVSGLEEASCNGIGWKPSHWSVTKGASHGVNVELKGLSADLQDVLVMVFSNHALFMFGERTVYNWVSSSTKKIGNLGSNHLL